MVKLMCDVKCALFFIQSVLDIFFPCKRAPRKEGQINLRKGSRYTTINEQYDDDFDENEYSAFLQEDDDDDDWRRRKRRKRKRWSVLAVVSGEKKNITNETQKKDGCIYESSKS